MPTVAATFSKASTKFQVGTAALALVAAATLTPPVVAHAQPLAPVTQGVGTYAAAANDDCSLPDDCTAGLTTMAVTAGPPTISSVFQNKAWWFGAANPNPPADTATVFTFTPLSLIPGFLQPLYSWFTQNLNFQACVFGASVKIGPYGSVTGSVGSSC